MTKKTHMTDPSRVLEKPKSNGVRQFVFVMFVSSAMAMSFFPGGRMSQGPVTAFASRLVYDWQETIGQAIHDQLPWFRSRN